MSYYKSVKIFLISFSIHYTSISICESCSVFTGLTNQNQSQKRRRQTIVYRSKVVVSGSDRTIAIVRKIWAPVM